jgi:hypothetical protein
MSDTPRLAPLLTELKDYTYGSDSANVTVRLLVAELTAQRAARAEAEQWLAELQGERDCWENTARDMARDMEFYRDIVDRCGEALGPEAKTCDDGTVVPEVLRAKVAELVEARMEEFKRDRPSRGGRGR